MQTGSALYPSQPRSHRVGGAIRPKTDLRRFVRWPKYVRLQKQKRILMERLRIPPSVEQFNRTATKNQTNVLLKLFKKYRPSTKKEIKHKLLEKAKEKVEGQAYVPPPQKLLFTFGLKEVTRKIEKKQAKLVLIAHDVDPLELVIFLPALCKKMDIPYAIVNNRARLGELCHLKTCSVVALTKINKEDEASVDHLSKLLKEFYAAHPRWGGGKLGLKTLQKLKKRELLLKKEAAKAAGAAKQRAKRLEINKKNVKPAEEVKPAEKPAEKAAEKPKEEKKVEKPKEEKKAEKPKEEKKAAAKTDKKPAEKPKKK